MIDENKKLYLEPGMLVATKKKDKVWLIIDVVRQSHKYKITFIRTGETVVETMTVLDGAWLYSDSYVVI